MGLLVFVVLVTLFDTVVVCAKRMKKIDFGSFSVYPCSISRTVIRKKLVPVMIVLLALNTNKMESITAIKVRTKNKTRTNIKTRQDEDSGHDFWCFSSIVLVFRMVYASHRCPICLLDTLRLSDDSFAIEEESERLFKGIF